MSRFDPMFERSRYLALLRFEGNVEDAIATLRELVPLASVDEVAALFEDANWRPNLVGAAALLMIKSVPDRLIDRLWAAFDRPSWVSPQLAVTACEVDPQFVIHAEARCERGAPKGRAALLALLGRPSQDVDPESHGDQKASKWRERIRERVSRGN